jgi:4-amino-4-deoxy-L-arabinose transferase-like glycosyltransferase
MFKFIETRPPWTLPAFVAVLTFICHLTYGIWFWTASPTNAPKTGLSLSGNAYLASYVGWDTDHEADGTLYNRTAVEALRTGVPRTRSGLFFEHAPVYSYFLAFCYKLGGIRMLAMAVPQAFLGAVTCFLVALTAIRLAPRHAALAGTAAALLMLINVRLAAFVGYPNPTILLLFLFALAVWAMTTSVEPALKPLFFVAIILAIYTQAAFFVIALAIVFWAAAMFWRSKSRSYLLAAILLVACAVTKPLIALVVDRSHETFLSEAPTFVLWEANNPYFDSMTVFSLWERRPTNPWSGWQPSEQVTKRYEEYLARAKGHSTQAALLWMRENPAQYLTLCVVRFKAVLGPFTGHMSPLNRKISTVLWVLIFPAGFYALWKYRHTRFALLAWSVILFQVSFETLVIAGWQPRYRLPIDLLLVAGAGVVYAEWAGRWFNRNANQATKPNSSGS